MALTPEDKKDVSKSMGKALANKVSNVTKDSNRAFQNKLFRQTAKKRRATPEGQAHIQRQKDSEKYHKEIEKYGYNPDKGR